VHTTVICLFLLYLNFTIFKWHATYTQSYLPEQMGEPANPGSPGNKSNCFTAIMRVSVCYSAPLVKDWRIQVVADGS